MTGCDIKISNDQWRIQKFEKGRRKQWRRVQLEEGKRRGFRGTEVPSWVQGGAPVGSLGVLTEVPQKLKAFRKKYAQNLFDSDE